MTYRANTHASVIKLSFGRMEIFTSVLGRPTVKRGIAEFHPEFRIALLAHASHLINIKWIS